MSGYIWWLLGYEDEEIEADELQKKKRELLMKQIRESRLTLTQFTRPMLKVDRKPVRYRRFRDVIVVERSD